MQTDSNQPVSQTKAATILPLIASAIENAGLQEDLPYDGLIGLGLLQHSSADLTSKGKQNKNAIITVENIYQLLSNHNIANDFINEYTSYLERQRIFNCS